MILALLLACTGSGPGSVNDEPTDCIAHSRLVAATTDFAVGSLLTVNLDTHEVRDHLAPTSGDPIVRAQDCSVYQLNRGTGDAVRIYEPGQWSAPAVEFALPGANPHDILALDGELFISQFERNELAVHTSADGAQVADIELLDWADEDGLVEADQVVLAGGKLYVALQRLDRTDGWQSTGGAVVEIDPSSRAVLRSWETGPNPRLFGHPAEQALIVLTGHFTALDGGAFVLDPDADELRAISPDSLPTDVVFADYAEGADGVGMLLAADLDNNYVAYCVDWSGSEPLFRSAIHTRQYLPDVVISDRGLGWVAVADGWPPTGESSGLLPIDLDLCEPVLDAPVATTLNPYSLAVY